jgi:hypothetical protein
VASIFFSSLAKVEMYGRLYGVLDRACKVLTAEEPTDFSNLFARLHFLCKKFRLPSHPIEIFRMHARKTLQERNFEGTHEDFLFDVKALCEFLQALTGEVIPQELQEALPAQWRSLAADHPSLLRQKRMRVVVESWEGDTIRAFDEAQPREEALEVCIPEEFAQLKEMLFPGAQLNLLSVAPEEDGRLHAELMVLEPDYLLDISSLAACYTNYGNTPLNYLLHKFRPAESTAPILLGNAANQFLDDCINETEKAPATYEQSIQKAFRADLMAYCVTPKIDRSYFEQAKEQFAHIHETLERLDQSEEHHIDRNQVVLEPSFLCECLGLQGRMDLLQTDGRNLIELKSGKADGWNGNIRAKSSHSLQMALYKEVLFYNLDIPRDKVNSYLFYSLYPKIYAERSSKGQIQQAMALRNAIVYNEILLKNGHGADLLGTLTPQLFNEKHDTGKLWRDYQLPQIEEWLRPFRQSSSLALNYFYSFLTFTEKEQFLSKVGDSNLDSSRGFSEVWNADLTTKQASGNILVDLQIMELTGEEGIEQILLSIPFYGESFLPNFRRGDVVLFYERNKEDDRAVNKQVFRGNVDSMTDTEVLITLRHKQRNRHVFHPESRYAMEHDFMDASYNTLYRGLYGFLKAPKERMELLLCERAPRVDRSLTLTGHYLNEQIEQIVLQAKQALDYFLLVGPPGTGKTSVALKSMVEEFYAQPDCQLLLLSYTNRAVDEICEMLESIEGGVEYVRIGNILSCEERFRERMLSNLTDACRNRNEIVERLRAVRIFVGTTASVSGKPELFQLKQFQVAIIDEASQILEPQLLNILCATRAQGVCAVQKFIMIGDPKQLPAVVLQQPRESEVEDADLRAIGLTNRRNSLFERFYRRQQEMPQEGILSMLNRQGRMHPEVNDFANRFFYEGKLEIIPLKHQQEDLEFRLTAKERAQLHLTPAEDWAVRLLSTQRVAFLPSPLPPPEDSPKINRGEAAMVGALVQGVVRLCALRQEPLNAAKRIGVIVPFRNQIALIYKQLRELNIPEADEITIDTVERFQGSQRDIIIYSTTISRPYQLDILSVPIEDHGYMIDRKLNVALTRARKQMFILGNVEVLQRNELYTELIRNTEVRE